VVGPTGAHPRIALINGLGSQGFLVGPWLAGVLAAHLVDQTPLPSELDPARFAPRPAIAGNTRWHAVDVARAITLRQLAPGEFAIDLTVGNGGDTLWLAHAVGPEGGVLGIDLQPEALRATRRRLDAAGCDVTVDLHCADHAALGTLVPVEWRGRVGAVVANLGCLPRSASPIVTQPATTIAAFAAALPLLRIGGVLVSVVYTRHPGGVDELAAIERWAAGLDPARFHPEWHRAPDHKPGAPVVFAVVCGAPAVADETPAPAGPRELF
jgi:predicted methyltransferase